MSKSENKKTKKSLSYADAGVDIAAGDDAVQRIKKLAQGTFNSQVLSEIGSFGGFFRPDLTGIAKPVLISSADGVGTKLKIAFMTDKHTTVGEDLVNHCIDDILVHGAKALFFLDYIATGKVKPEVIAEIVEGFARGCKNAGVALLGGETAEMPGLYAEGEYDLAGFIVGIIDEDKVINGSTIKEGDVCIGLASNGLHTNGYTLARKVVFEIAARKPGDPLPGTDMTVDQALMQVHRCYAPLIHPLLDKYEVHGMAHITGGGIPGNLSRIIPDGLSAQIRMKVAPIPPIFDFLQTEGGIDESEMYHAFNMGLGFIMVVPAEIADDIIKSLADAGEIGYRVGKIASGEPKVQLI